MMSTTEARNQVATAFPSSFAAWRADQRRALRLPVIAVAGTRGKSTVVRMVDHIFRSVGLRTCIWTDDGVETNGELAAGELAPWAAAMRGLASGDVDVAIQELDWQTVRAVGLPDGAFSLLAVTNLCGNSDACLVHRDGQLALGAYPSVLRSLAPEGRLVLNAEDYAVANPPEGHARSAVLVGHNRDAPILRRHLDAGAIAAWVDGDLLTIGTGEVSERILATLDLDFALRGAASFEVVNALIATALSLAGGLDGRQVAAALATFGDANRLLPGSFNVFRAHDRLAVVERPLPSWFLRSVLRALTTRRRGRLIALLGGVSGGSSDDELIEVGRLIGRTTDALVIPATGLLAGQLELIKLGVAHNDLPPVIFWTPSEWDGVQRALRMARSEDTMLFITDQPRPILDLLAADHWPSPDHALTT